MDETVDSDRRRFVLSDDTYRASRTRALGLQLRRPYRFARGSGDALHVCHRRPGFQLWDGVCGHRRARDIQTKNVCRQGMRRAKPELCAHCVRIAILEEIAV